MTKANRCRECSAPLYSSFDVQDGRCVQCRSREEESEPKRQVLGQAGIREGKIEVDQDRNEVYPIPDNRGNEVDLDENEVYVTLSTKVKKGTREAFRELAESQNMQSSTYLRVLIKAVLSGKISGP